jgi:hypothetical protein
VGTETLLLVGFDEEVGDVDLLVLEETTFCPECLLVESGLLISGDA